MIVDLSYVACTWFMVGSIVIWYLLCHSRIKDEYLDRTNDVIDTFVDHGARRRAAQYLMMVILVTCWPIIMVIATLETIGRGWSDRGGR